MLTDGEAISRARHAAEAAGWPWREPVSVAREVSRRSTRTARAYDLIVRTFTSGRDCNIWIRIDGDTGEILDGVFHGGRSPPKRLAESHERGLRSTTR